MTREAVALSLLPVALLAAGCAHRVTVRYDSMPLGAVLYQGERFLGPMPHDVRMEVTPEERRRGRKVVPGGEAVWLSGARVELPEQTIDLRAPRRAGEPHLVLFPRPPDAPGAAVDIERGEREEAARAIQRASDAYFIQRQLRGEIDAR